MKEWTQIVQCLTEMGAAYETLYALSLEKKEALVDSNAEGVRHVTDQEWAIVAQVNALETQRTSLSEAVARQKGENPEGVTVSQLAEWAETDEDRFALLQAAQALSNAVVKQAEVNDVNRQLLETHFQYIDYMINNCSYQQVSNTYGKSGQETYETQSGSFGLLNSEV